ncbi:hypothetical protein M9H77_07490 [Catharanthus roseus]|uniref:Uncharacterized protein n=1 Tax=Catharanthus roseus TaxID=4058 RepID=A0ACC0BV49_CATRO|nr:hypothetical protein M9H77_07490 [Catharanthus roseus]
MFIVECSWYGDYLKNREHDNYDSLMIYIQAKNWSNNLITLPDKRGKIAQLSHKTSLVHTKPLMCRKSRKTKNLKRAYCEFGVEYAEDVDYLKNKDHENCDSFMTLILVKTMSNSLLVLHDKCGNIPHFIKFQELSHKASLVLSFILSESRKMKNLKCVWYSVNGECHVLLVATHNIAKGERLYYDYNVDENEYQIIILVKSNPTGNGTVRPTVGSRDHLFLFDEIEWAIDLLWTL